MAEPLVKQFIISLHAHLGLSPGFPGQPPPSPHCQHHLSLPWRTLKVPLLPSFKEAAQVFAKSEHSQALFTLFAADSGPDPRIGHFFSAVLCGQGLVELSLQSWLSFEGSEVGNEVELEFSTALSWPGVSCRQKRTLGGGFQLPTEMARDIWRSIHLRAAESHLVIPLCYLPILCGHPRWIQIPPTAPGHMV